MLEFRRGVQQKHRLSTCRMELQQNASEQSQEIMSRMLEAFFGEQHRMQRSIIVLCENNLKQNTDTLTPTILIMLTCPLQKQVLMLRELIMQLIVLWVPAPEQLQLITHNVPIQVIH